MDASTTSDSILWRELWSTENKWDGGRLGRRTRLRFHEDVNCVRNFGVDRNSCSDILNPNDNGEGHWLNRSSPTFVAGNGECVAVGAVFVAMLQLQVPFVLDRTSGTSRDFVFARNFIGQFNVGCFHFGAFVIA